MHSFESVLQLLRDYQMQKLPVETFIDDFQEIYFNGRVFDQVPDSMKEAMDNIVLGIGLTKLDDEERDDFGSYISPEALLRVVEENLALIEAQL